MSSARVLKKTGEARFLFVYMLYISQKHKRDVRKKAQGLSLFGLLLALFLLAETSSALKAADVTAGALTRLANESRKEAGLGELKSNNQLKQAAEAKAKDMLKNNYFAHTSPKGVTPWHWIKQAGYQYGFAGENLAINYETAESQHKAWMKSPTHKANILNKNYQEVGIAVVEGKIDGKEAQITVQVFASPKVAPAVSLTPKEYLPNTEKLVADVKGVEAELSETLIPTEMREPFVQTEPVLLGESVTTPVAPVLSQQNSPFDLSIYLTLILLQVVVFMAAMPFLYLTVIEFQAFYALTKCRVLEETVHAFSVHHPKAL